MLAKDNIFDHIYYEINEYLVSFKFITQNKFLDAFLIDPNNNFGKSYYLQSIKNSIWTAHFVHMRSLIDFFSNIKNPNVDDDIILETILVPTVISPCLLDKKTDLDYMDKSGKKIFYGSKSETLRYTNIINKSIQHLSTKRAIYDDLKTSVPMEDLQSQTITNMYDILHPRIKAFINLLSNPANLCAEYQNDYNDYDKLFRRL